MITSDVVVITSMGDTDRSVFPAKNAGVYTPA